VRWRRRSGSELRGSHRTRRVGRSSAASARGVSVRVMTRRDTTAIYEAPVGSRLARLAVNTWPIGLDAPSSDFSRRPDPPPDQSEEEK